ncbi:prephenate dehydrogenase (NADP(+)) [Mucor velutinosus]|uniref:Prephenate dehydrogenase (NADP(+)) n=1 Tax=Mucor velutinosus TaxID=708070 RepID=A0AAN7I3F8_9FUNG|nr:prephenate dehydrogenase (NADP(+)) [Mucor velutinosus]
MLFRSVFPRRRVDVILVCETSANDVELELCHLGFKRSAVSDPVLKQQQNKSLKINAGIPNGINLSLDNIPITTYSMDFAESAVYAVRLIRFQYCMAVFPMGRFSLMTSLL